MPQLHWRQGAESMAAFRSEVEVEAAEVHLLEVLAVVHVAEVVNVRGPAQAVDRAAFPQQRHPGVVKHLM